MGLLEKMKQMRSDRKAKKEKQKKDRKNMTFKEKVVENVNVFLSAYLIAFVIRLFLIEAYQIPSQSMVPSLMVKDILMVEKLSFGSVFPVTRWKIPGIIKPRRNDVIVFISPEWKSPGVGKELVSLFSLSLINLDNTFETPKNLVKRMVARPGDKVSMSNQVLTINGTEVNANYLKSVRQVQYNQLVKESRKPYFDLVEESYSNKTRIVQHIKGIREAFLVDYKAFNNPDFIANFNDYRSLLVFGFPEIEVPRKDVAIVLSNKNNYHKYLLKLLIERETGKAVFASTDGKFFIEGQEIKEYTPKNNYYFGMGDNRDNSEDCRYFGFIPEKNIFGRILFRYFPLRRFGFRIDETAKSVVKKSFED